MLEESESSGQILGKGKISRIQDGVAWGQFEDGFTFDLPVSDAHKVGDDVQFSSCDDPEDIGSTHTFLVMGDRFATILWCDEGPEGFEIVNSETLTR